jgi:hypothetical protein
MFLSLLPVLVTFRLGEALGVEVELELEAWRAGVFWVEKE